MNFASWPCESTATKQERNALMSRTTLIDFSQSTFPTSWTASRPMLPYYPDIFFIQVLNGNTKITHPPSRKYNSFENHYVVDFVVLFQLWLVLRQFFANNFSNLNTGQNNSYYLICKQKQWKLYLNYDKCEGKILYKI